MQSQPGTHQLAVLNQGIGGNRLFSGGLGPNALSRIDSDVIAQAGARYLIVLEGINDIGVLRHSDEVPAADHDALVRRIIAAYQQIIVRAHTHNIRVIGATLLPFAGSDFYHPGPTNEAARQAVNAWIRTPGNFDAVMDFDKITRDPDTASACCLRSTPATTFIHRRPALPQWLMQSRFRCLKCLQIRRLRLRSRMTICRRMVPCLREKREWMSS